MTLFSVIIPHYNTVAYLERLIQTIPEEQDIQLIVVDDKSKEDISSVEKKVFSRGGIFIRNTTDKKGAGVCRNLGLKQAKGKWLVFADADDYFLEDAFLKLRKYAESKADIIYFLPTSKYENSDEIAERHIYYESLVRRYQKNPSEHNENSLRYKFVVPWSKMIRNEIIKNNHVVFDETLAANDVMFSMKSAYYAKEIDVSLENIYCTIRAENTLTTKHDENNFMARVEVFKRMYFFIRENLNVKEFGFWDLSGISVMKRAIKQGYSYRFVFGIYKFFRENNVTIISWQGAMNSVLHHLKKIT